MTKRSKSTDTTDTTAAAPRVALYGEPDGVAVVFPPERNPGVQSFGAMRPGVVYVVSPAEADRLTAQARPAHARFDRVDSAAATTTTE